MKNIIVFLIFMHCISIAQTTETISPLPKHQFIIHTYPTTIFFGDLSLGAEHQYRQRWAHEFSFYLKTFENKQFYDKGYRMDYFIKYNFLNRKKVRMSFNLTVMKRDIYFENKSNPYYYGSDHGPVTAYGPYMILKEDKQYRSYGWGLGLSCNMRIYRKFYLGCDVTFYSFRSQTRRTEQEVLYRAQYVYYLDGKTFPSYTVTNSGGKDMMLRIKLSYLLYATKH